MSATTFSVTFAGGTGDVTGANFLLETANKKILVDCGMFQGSKFCDSKNVEEFLYDPASIDILFITHAHQDHIGRVPKLVKDGFRGIIYSTRATKELSAIMLADTARILGENAKNEGVLPLYDQKNVEGALVLWKVIPYHGATSLAEDLMATLFDAGHVLGSAMIKFEHNGKSILFTGDLGNCPSPLLHNIEEVKKVNYVVMESVYGDRNHEERGERTKQLEEVIQRIIAKKGVLVIPAFSLERTQEILFEINNFVENKKIVPVSVYLDSPLSIRVTEAYKENKESFNAETRRIIQSGDDIFAFKGLMMTESAEESKKIAHAPNPKVIIAGAGMMNGGRILHHAKNYLPDKNNILLFVGYQAAGTLGRIIKDGAKEITIYHEKVPVRAELVSIEGYSGHAGSDQLVEFVSHMKDTLKKVFCVMGEKKSALFLVQRLRDYLGVEAHAPEKGEKVELE